MSGRLANARQKNQTVKTVEKVASQISGEGPANVPEGCEGSSSYLPECKGLGSEWELGGGGRGQVWEILNLLPVGRGWPCGKLDAERQRGDGLLAPRLRGKDGGKRGSPGSHSGGDEGGWRELTPHGLNFLYKNQVRSSNECLWGEGNAEWKTERRRAVFEVFSLKCVAWGWPGLGNWWFVLFLSRSIGSAKERIRGICSSSLT